MKATLQNLNPTAANETSKPVDYSILPPKYKQDEQLKAFFAKLSFLSPYLGKIVCDDPTFFALSFHKDPTEVFKDLLADFAALPHNMENISANLRHLKKQASLVIAMADIRNLWTMEQVTKALSSLAKVCLDTALKTLLTDEMHKGNLSCDDIQTCGISIIAMGKLGADELNYSSDIDLIFLFDPVKAPYQGSKELPDFMIRLAKRLVTLIDEKTKDGYAFRTDLRIRPDPSSTPIIISLNAALNYYECFGKNWERAAMIKASPISGDISVGKEFMSRIYPFVWRRSLDFKTIMDIKNIRKQISNINGSDITKSSSVFGYNVKLGKGGIRDIEFFAQIGQLIWGGRNKELQTRSTVKGLEQLAKHKYITAKVAKELTANYIFLRTLEHRLQMVNDEQTHSLPKTPKELEKIALFTGFKDMDSFTKAVIKTLKSTCDNTLSLFADKQKPLDFGTIDGNEALMTFLETHNFKHPQECCHTIINWSSGIYRTIRSGQSLCALSNVLYALLKQISALPDPDGCLYRFDNLLRILPSGVQLLPLFEAKPEVMDTVIDIIGNTCDLSQNIQKNPYLIEDLINPDFFAPLPTKEQLSIEVQSIAALPDEESAINALQIWSNSQKFRAGIHLLKGLTDGTEAGIFLSNVAGITLSTLIPFIDQSFSKLYGTISNAKTALLMLGKNGSLESTPSSDLDLIFIYDCPQTSTSDGVKKLDAKTYYARFVQRLISILTTAGKYGKIWEVDMRLRPSGNTGPLATSMEAFVKYHQTDAWIWEKMALTKAKKVYGTIDIEKQITAILSAKADIKHIKQAIYDMRQKLISEHQTTNPWDIKNISGGMIDIEFIAQYLELAFTNQYPDILQGNTIKTLSKAKTLDLLPLADLDFLIATYGNFLTLNALLSLNNNANGKINPSPTLPKTSKWQNTKGTETYLLASQQLTRELFNKIIKL